MSKTTALAKNTLLVGISSLSTQLVMFLMLPLYTASLSTSEYGAVDLIITYGGLLAPLIMLNVQQAIFRHLIDARSDREIQNKIITNAVEISVVASLAAALVYLIANFIIDIPFAATMVFYFASVIIADLVLQIARGLGRTKAFAITGIAQGLLTVTLNLIFMSVLKMGANGMLLGMSLGLMIPAIALAIIIGVHHSVNLSARNRETKKQLLAFSLPLLPNTLSWWVFNASDRTIISLVLGLAANGIYAVSNKFSNIANSFGSIFYTSWSEHAVLAINDPDRDEFFSNIANIMLRAFTTLGILIMCSTPIVFPFLVNETFNEALLYLPILILGTIFSTVVSFYSAIYIAKKLTKQVANTSIIAAVINLVVNLGLIWSIGIWAAAISTAVAYGVMAIYRHYDMKKYMTITYEKNLIIKLVLLYGVVSMLYYTNSLWTSVAGFIVAAAAAYWLNRYEIGRIREMVLLYPSQADKRNV
jgi:O-antigen/teichoic acid export membrane protein